METNTLIGNVCREPKLWLTKKTGTPMATFTIAVNRRHRAGDELVDRPAVFHRIICFGSLAENVNNSLHKGMEVLAVGEWVDDSYEDEHGQKQTKVAMEARAVGAGLRWAIASVTKVERHAPVIALADLKIEPADDHKPGEFSANTKPVEPSEPVAAAARTTRKGERQAARAG